MKKNRWPWYSAPGALVLGVALTAAASTGGYSPYNAPCQSCGGSEG